MEEVLEAVYTDPSHPGSYGGVDKLRRALKKSKNFHVRVEDVKKWFKHKDTYTKHRTARVQFHRNPVIATHIDAQWQGDLADVGNFSSSNDGMRYLLILIDVVSKYVWVEPLRTKSGPTVLEGLKAIFARTDRRPEKLQTDEGTEFLYRGMQEYLKENNIGFFTLKSDKKAALAERMVRTLKEKIWRYTHEKHTNKYIDVLQDLVSSYNGTYHNSIKRAPAEVTEKNEGEVLRILYGKIWNPKKGVKKEKEIAKVGDFVRISGVKGVFRKGYKGSWTREIFIVTKVIQSFPHVMYKLQDWHKVEIEGSFYQHEIQVVDAELDGYWKVERFIKKKYVRGKLMHFVKWEGYPESHNSWVSAKDVKDVV
jgi:hypothetical protein